MADFYSQASFVIPLNAEQLTFANKVIECALGQINDDIYDFNEDYDPLVVKSVSEDVYTMAKALVLQTDDYEKGCVCLGFLTQAVYDGLWITGEENINDELAANFTQMLLQYFDLDICVCFGVAYTCSKPRLDAFGGDAVFVTKKEVEYISSTQWLSKKKAEFEKQLSV